MKNFETASELGPETFLRLAEEALAGIPAPLRQHVEGVGIVVEDLAGPETLTPLGMSDPWRLLGVYQGVPLPKRSLHMIATSPDRIALFRLPIMRQWRARGGALEDIVRHVLVHEIGHHFGFSDADMAAIERDAD